MTPCCSKCGQTLPPKHPAGLDLPPGYAVIFERVRRAGVHGIHAADLFDYVYGGTADAGPDSYLVCLRTRIGCLNRNYLVKRGWRIRAKAGRGSTGYKLEKLP